jgi:KUP system potassium uptake protein
MLAWFLVLALTGVRQVAADPSILRGLSPNYGVEFFAAHPNTAFMAMGAVALTITGAEALFADLGHFGRRPIRRAWFAVVFPSLTLNYLAQGSIILRHPATKANPFFLLVPAWAQIPLVALAAAATVIASQAVISGAFSVSHQAIQLGLLPRLRSHHTSRQNARRVYVGAVNWALFAAVLAVTVGFGSAARLATAYGVTVSGTFLITTTLLLNLARTVWRWRTWQLLAATIGIGAAELTYFAANLTKVTHGGWLPILIALTLFTIMMTWHRAHEGAQSDGWPVTRIPIQL